MDSKEIADGLEHVIGDMMPLIDELKGKPGRLGSFIDPVCWNCGKAYKTYLPESYTPVYKPCEIWRKDKKCDFEPRER